MNSLKKKEQYLFLTCLFVLFIGLCSVQNAFAVTVYPGTHFGNSLTNYTANAHPNFNVTSITIQSNHIFLGTPSYDMTWIGNQVKANVTSFFEGKNATFQVTNNPVNMKFDILGLVQSVSLDGVNQPYGSTWSYINSNTYTEITPTTHHTIFINWLGGSISVSNYKIAGIALSGGASFSNQNLTLSSPANANLTTVMLFNGAGLQDSVTFNPPIPLVAGTQLKIPITLADTSGSTGTQSYYEEAIINSPTNVGIVTSNTFVINLGQFQPGRLNFNQTNTNVLPIYFITTSINKTDLRLSVIYPNTMSLQCNLAYTYAFTNKTYGAPLPNVPYTPDPNHVNSSFVFHNVNNEIINVLCTDTITNQTGKYLITQTNFIIQQQVNQFKGGTFGTHGQFGVFDFVSLIGVIVAMIGFNRVNETVGAFFCITIVGMEGFFQIVTIPTAIIAALITVVMLIILSTRKTGGFP